MVEWQKYQRSDGEFTEIGAFILEAATNGTWVVRHKMGEVPCRVSSDLGRAQSGGIEEAKVLCMAEFLRMTAAYTPTKDRTILINLCERYRALRILQRSAASVEEMNTAAEDLDERVAKFLSTT